jgi:hypothetical protein
MVSSGKLTAQPAAAQATRSTMRVVLAVGMVEADEHFDVVNAYDIGYVSIGLCHWTLGLRLNGFREGELGGLLALFKQRFPDEFRALFRRFGVDVKEWSTDGNSLAEERLRVFTARPERIDDSEEPAVLKWVGAPGAQVMRVDFAASWRDAPPPGTRTAWDQPDAFEYFRTWPFFYRFVMAGRAGSGLRRTEWDMARIRLRDLSQIVWVHDQTSADYLYITDAVAGVVRPATFGDIFSSERAMALILRWHVNWPTTLLHTFVAGGVSRPEAHRNLLDAFRALVPANPGVFGAGGALRRDVATWTYPVVNGQQDETMLGDSLRSYIQGRAAAVPPNNSWINLDNSTRALVNWAGYDDPDLGYHMPAPSTARGSFALDSSGLPPIPPKFVP